MVELELQDGLAVVTIDRPHARNALDLPTMGELEKVLDSAEGAVALAVTGAGDRAFVSGGDLKELARLRTETEASAMALRMRALCDRISAFPGPVLAALNGHALGGGAEVAVAADIRVAAEDIRLGFNQTSLAIVPAWGGAERLARLVGPGRALLLAGTGRVLNASEAERMGLVDLVLPRTGFDEGWREMARSLATRQAREIKNLTTRTRSPQEAAAAFARFWVAEEHWRAAEKVMSRGR
ncbi:MAG TPA: enoyl-CoA hydratase/isomerase family protein [Streptomyces sp.]|uniref:enoyl-CoA hydratase/isomerase family protein n=1 Tax=Streptomyces sp. TaxID=1931 RepID=UPI002B53C9AD|nr:enoyl-CoA hydratase/isomerase family protein [Streptomyces sp.]HWU04809.1 enoyl-CoA hydratase/isomerase family protein [Streptomyces sp.]